MNWFLSLDDVREKIGAFKDDYNGFRSHISLGNLTPNEVVAEYLKAPEFSPFWRC